ncbi:MAG: hypothetical protein E3J52_04320 [Promethearchaeota archaeon]|nr:MAG: hypothetical protein E3J52_04320 [Candidatus Lokiarchaeota archaeon]
MLDKSKLNLSVILLVIGIGLIPTGLFIDGYLTDQVSSDVSTVLLEIKDEAVSEIEELYLGLGIPEVLPELFDNLVDYVENGLVYYIGIPKALIYIKNKTIEKFPYFINGSGAALAINDTIDQVISAEITTLEYALEVFFNDINFQNNFSVQIKGVSENMTSGILNLTYSADTAYRLLYGYNFNETSYPGIFENQEYGTGVYNWLDFYSDAEADKGNNQTLIEIVYNCSWSSKLLQNFSAYIKSYLWDVIVKDQYDPMELETYAELVFFDQWANATFRFQGISLREISDDITADVYGLEVGRGDPSNISRSIAEDLWDPLNDSAFINGTGILKWIEAAAGNLSAESELISTFGLTGLQMNQTYEWLTISIQTKIVPVVFYLPPPDGFGIGPTEYAEILLLDQWANATYYTEGINLGMGLKGFEAGIPTKSNISEATALSLFNTSNSLSFIHRDGILNWIDAYEGDVTSQTEILSSFSLDLAQLNVVTDWLFTTLRYDVIPSVTLNITKTTMIVYAEREFYCQWSDGKLFENGIDLGPLLGLDIISGWELGIPMGSNINEIISIRLWSDDIDASLIDYKGISKWFKAMGDSSTYNYLQTKFGLNNSQMDQILAWLIEIRENFALPIAQMKRGLPVDHYTLGNNLFLGFTIAGGVLVGLGVIGIILQVILKRK